MPGREARNRAWKIALISASVLVLELTFIRQIPAEVRAISYFTNLLLLAAFFGLGIGCILQEKLDLSWLLPAGVGLMWGFVRLTRGVVIYSESKEVHYWLQYSELGETAPHLPLFPLALAAFVIGAAPFVTMGQRLARAMNEQPRLRGYGWDIFGSLVGSVLFSVSAAIHVPPWIWPSLVLGLWALFIEPRWVLRGATVLAGVLFLTLAQPLETHHWSPYYLVQHQKEETGLRVWVNSSFHQFALDFETENPNIAPKVASVLQKFTIPYDVYRDLHGGVAPEKVLILGAGTGNDVHVALENGASEIVAVEIDPVIMQLGVEESPTDPYGDPRVRRVVDDARHYVRTAPERFDLVVLGTLDSQTLLSGLANLRLENYVYTRESFSEIHDLLEPGGMMASYYSIFASKAPWVFGRLLATVQESFGADVRILGTQSQALFNTIIVAGAGIAEYQKIPALEPPEGVHILTDDWPYLYLERPTVAPVYLKLFASIVVLILLAFFLVRRIHPVRGLHGNFLLLGLGFTLMESAAIVRLALLFGSTWVVNAVVFAAVLVMIFISNLLVARGRAPSLHFAWAGLFASVLLMYLFPIELLFDVPAMARVLGASALVGLPVFFAGVCFSTLFSKQPTTGYALGINLVGAMAGGLVEYLSMLVGMKAVWLIVLCVYLSAFLFSRLSERDRAAA